MAAGRQAVRLLVRPPGRRVPARRRADPRLLVRRQRGRRRLASPCPAAGARAAGALCTPATPPARRAAASSATAPGHWRQGRQGRQQVWLEYDPATGTHGRASLPAFLQSGIREDATLLQENCELLPLQPGLEQTPFGTDGTVLGRWVRTEGEGGEARTVAGTPDGRTVTLPWAGGRAPGVLLGALRLPGGAEPVAVRLHRQIALYSATTPPPPVNSAG